MSQVSAIVSAVNNDADVLASAPEAPITTNGKGKAKPDAKPENPVVSAYRALVGIGLERTKQGDSFRAVDHVAVASMARRQLGKLASASLAGVALVALHHIATIEKHSADCLPTAIGGANPHKVRIGEVFGAVLGYATDERKVRRSQVAEYIAGLK